MGRVYPLKHSQIRTTPFTLPQANTISMFFKAVNITQAPGGGKEGVLEPCPS